MRQHVEQAVILAAGMGTRLKWLTQARPKALMNVGGEPAVARVIRRLVAQGVRDIAVNAHHHADQLAEYLGDGSRFGCRIAISREPELLDSGGGVKQALQYLPGEGPVLVHNADVMADVDLQRLAAVLPEGGGAIALVANPPHHPQGDFALGGGMVSAAGDDRFTFAGVSLWDRRVFAAYESEDRIFSLARTIREQISAGRCAGMIHRGPWFDIGRPTDLVRADRMLR